MRDRTNTWRERDKGLVKNSEIANHNANTNESLNIFCFVFLGKHIWVSWFSSQKVLIEWAAGVNKAKICWKTFGNCKYSYLQCNNSNAIHIFMIFWESISKCNDFKHKHGHRNQQKPQNCQNLQTSQLTRQ